MSNEKEKPEGCDSCGWETVELTFYISHGATIPEAWLCEVCESTFAGNAYHYPRQYQNKEIMRMISYTTNMILAEIRKGRP